ncbi:kinesin-like protein KIN-14K [Papaver somniferum]|uniref:kinesin-like protein KIN-14K n=1 Tax=Papaver somniferum TaxID=3469 RepID=UPI000E702209|nr:kinesin-like protein KIN-14K [Papaver somniferum]XP_026444903.1 kinesin-like protein KIN-14K [Papaver somniferum]XP_026444904.1 kinesin-like protein KIN-14K [Papaver somniferum]XP_026444905.1 kinesin-like protein KIN-14K [Papaver somniferum]
MEAMDYFNSLPVEITLDIFKRLPVDTVKACKLVSKTWKNLIHHPKFVVMHFIHFYDSSTENVTELVHKFTGLQAISKYEVENWYKTEEAFHNFKNFYLQLILGLVQMAESSMHAVKVLKNYGLGITDLGGRFDSDKSKESCHSCLVESRRLFRQNCRLYNEFLVSKVNVRVYGCVRPCTDQNQTIIEYIGKDGELVIADPSVHTDDGYMLFKFNKRKYF